jgi:hypothetical protein
MRRWRPIRTLGGVIGLLLALGMWLEAAAFALLLPGPVTAQTFWYGLSTLGLFVLGCIVLYWAVAFFTLRYSFDRNGLTVYWGATRQVIPMNHIAEIRKWKEGERVRRWGIFWPGYGRGRARSTNHKVVHFFATAGRADQLLVCTPAEDYVLSPRDPKAFLQEIEVRRNLGITRQLTQERAYWWIFEWPLWRIPALWFLSGITLAINFSLVGFLCFRYPTLPPLIPIHFVEVVEDSQVRIIADVIGRSADLFEIPVFGLLIFAGNFSLGVLVHRRHRLLLMLLLVVALVVQVIFWLGVFYILSH